MGSTGVVGFFERAQSAHAAECSNIADTAVCVDLPCNFATATFECAHAHRSVRARIINRR